VSLPLMWPDLPETSVQLEELKQAVLRNPLVYGPYVSKDLQATLITVDFIDEQVDYGKVFHEIRDLIASVDDGSVNIRVVGDPILRSEERRVGQECSWRWSSHHQNIDTRVC